MHAPTSGATAFATGIRMPNVDQEEVSRFDALASRWWDPRGEFRALHDLNPVRLAFIDQHAPLRGSRVADIGCGGGILAEAMALAGARVVAVDAASAPLDVARLHQHESGADVDYRLATAEDLALEHAASFDTVTCMELIEHVPDAESLVLACARLVQPGGHVFFSTISRTAKAYALAVLGAEYVLGLLPRGTHDFRRFVRPSELAGAARRCGLQTDDLRGVGYNPLTGTARLAAAVDVNYLACFRRDPEHA